MRTTPPQGPRFAQEAAITVHGNGLAVAGTTRSLTRRGLCADLGVPLRVGADVRVDIQLVFDGGVKSEALQVEACVVWCTRLDGICQTGLAFQRLRPHQANFLAVFLRHLDHETRREQVRVRGQTVDERFNA